MKEKKKIVLLISFFLVLNNLIAQVSNKELVQFSGVIVTADSLNPVPFTNIIVKGTGRGTVSDYYGFFSFIAKRKDTLIFSSIGYKNAFFIIPDTITSNRYSLIQIMTSDTILLAETVIYPWPTKEQFKEAFINLYVPDDDYERAKKNLARAEMKERTSNYKMDGSLNYKNYIDQQTSKLYYIGQYQPISILNPFAWAKFIKAWQNGDFKNK